MRRLCRESGVGRLRLGSLEPTELSDDLIAELASNPALCNHLHIPLQAGSDSVLKRMNRHYHTAFFRALLQRAAAAVPDLAIGLDVIAGFPGESEAEFAATCELLQSLPISHLHVFPFSRRPGTPAATLPGQLPGDLIKDRAARLRAIGGAKLQAFAVRFVGRELDVVVEGGGGDSQRRGLSRNYLAVRLGGAEEFAGREVRVRITGVRGDELTGEVA